jgi:hypothetical protein
MAVTTTLTQAELARVMETAYAGRSIVAALVYAPSAPAVNDSIAEWLQYELDGTNGYQRFVSSAMGAGSYDGVDARWEQSPITIGFTASGGSFTYTHVVVTVDGAADGYVGTIDASSDVDAATDEITIASHGLNFGDAVALSTSTGTLPSGVTAATVYYVDAIDANTFTLHTDALPSPSNIVDITAIGSGSVFVHNCAGDVHSILAESSTVVILDGETKNYQLTIATDD